MREIWNFSAGPAQLPTAVLKKAQEELLSYNDKGMSIMELSHRSNDFIEIYEDTDKRFRQTFNIPDMYTVLYLQGGASQQFVMAPMNLRKNGKAAYIHTGNWSKKAMDEAIHLGFEVDILGSSEEDNFTTIPEWETDFDGYDYVHITTNNTIEGTTFYEFPDTGNVPLVADMSSNILSETIDINKFGLIYAGAQKNLGIAGLTLVIIRKDLLNMNPHLPNIFNYQTHAKKDSMYNTPPTFPIYILNLILKWLENVGGLEKMEEMNRNKADRFYTYLDQSDLFNATVYGADRSIMNIPFVTEDETIDHSFIRFAEENGIRNIKGHRSVGGMRASMYNAMPFEGVDALIETMKAFEENQKERL